MVGVDIAMSWNLTAQLSDNLRLLIKLSSLPQGHVLLHCGKY